MKTDILKGKDADWWANKLINDGDWTRRRAAERFVGGDDSARSGMFYWGDSPQGFDYWSLMLTNGCLEEGRSFIRWLLKGTVKDEETEIS